MKPLEYNTGKVPVWCPGCGNFAIWNSIKKGLSLADVDAHKLALVSGIGCSGKMINHIKAYGLHALHGRTLPVATGIKLANPDMTVLVNGGDGDGYGMGVGHFVHALRRNIDMTYIVHNNRVYGLTTGQASPTSELGTPTKSTPFGVVDSALNPMMVALSSGATFIARSYSGESEHLSDIIHQAINHKGFSYIDVFQPCVTFGGKFKFDYYNERIRKIDADHDTSSQEAAIALMKETEQLPIGVFYKEDRASYVDEHPEILKNEGVREKDISKLLETFR